MPRETYTNDDLVIVPTYTLTQGDIVRSLAVKDKWGTIQYVHKTHVIVAWDDDYADARAMLFFNDKGKRLDILRVRHADEPKPLQIKDSGLSTGARDYLRSLVTMDDGTYCSDAVYVELEAFLQ